MACRDSLRAHPREKMYTVTLENFIADQTFTKIDKDYKVTKPFI